MKKKLALLLATLMCISLCACGGSETSSGDNTDTKTEIENESNQVEVNQNINSEVQRETTEEGYTIISKKEFASYITKVELTTENWKEYMDIVEKTIETKNKFGEVISTTTNTSLTAKNALACYFDDFAIELTIIESGETIYSESLVGKIGVPILNNAKTFKWEDYVIDDFVCERIIGDLYILKDIPNECISVDENGTEFICIGSSDDYMKSEFEYLGMDLVMAYRNFAEN